MTRPLTERQTKVLQFITGYIDDHGYPPTQREIMRRFKMKSTRGVARHLEALEKKGYLTRSPGEARALEVHGLSQGIPVIGKVAAGQPILAVENVEGRIDLSRGVALWKDAFFLKVKGESMKEAGILEGDLVLVKSQPDADSGEIVVAMVEGEATVKRLFRDQKGVSLQAENPAYPPIPIEHRDETRILGKVIGVLRLY